MTSASRGRHLPTWALVSSLLGAGCIPSGPPAEQRFDFREAQFDGEQLRVLGPETTEMMARESDGLLVEIREGEGVEEVGFSPRVGLQGDFEIVVAYEIVDVAPPDRGYGVGPPVYLATASRDEHAASMSRARRPGEGDVYTAHAAYFARTETGERRRQQRLRTVPTTATAGQLCLRRIGNELHYLVADAFTTERRTVTWDAVVAAGLLAAFLLGTGAWSVWKGAAGRAVRDLPEEEPEQGKGADEAAGEAVAMTVPMPWAALNDDRLRKA